MPSPFPGMDPWLEGDLFPDLHAELISNIREALNAVMPPGYAAIGNYLIWTDAPNRRRVPDVSMLGPRSKPTSSNGTAALRGLTAVGTAPAPVPRKAAYLEIRKNRGKRLVTAVEILSPSNKVRGGDGRKAYRKKQAEFRRKDANVVEFDFLRRGTHTTAVPLARLRQVADHFDYHVSVLVAGDDDELYVAPIRLSDRLPTIDIPLDAGVPAVPLDLQPLFDRAYDTGRYTQFLDYARPPDPPLTPDQAAWAAELLRAKGVADA